MAFTQTGPEMVIGFSAFGNLWRYLDNPYAYHNNWVPQKFIRVNYDTRESGGKKELFARANKRVKEIISYGIHHLLTVEAIAILDEIILNAEKRRGIF